MKQYKIKKSGAGRVFGVIALVLVLILITGALGYITKGFKNWKPDTWFPKTEPTTKGDVMDENGNSLESGKVYPMPSKMLFTSPTKNSTTASEGITLKAVIKPDNATYKDVRWSLTFKDSSSSDRPVSDYVTHVVSGDNNELVKLTVLSAFSKQIIITARSVKDNSQSISCTLDFLAKIYLPYGKLSYDINYDSKTLNYSFPNSEKFSKISVTNSETVTFSNITSSVTVQWNTGSVKEEIVSSKITLTLNDSFKAKALELGLSINADFEHVFDPATPNTMVIYDDKFFIEKIGVQPTSAKFIEIISIYTNILTIKTSVTTEYGNILNRLEDLSFQSSSFIVPSTGIEIEGDSNIVIK